MKILYAIQGTGNGHITRGIEIIPHLQQHGAVDVLISGSQWNVAFPFKIKYRFGGMGFVFGNNGGVDILKTYLQMKSLKLMREVKSLPVEQYDLIISDFEPISCWAAHLKKMPCIGLSNQAATLHPLAPKPKSIDPLGKLVLQYYAPVTNNYGYHFKKFDKNVFTPVIRKQVREQKISDKGHFTVYLPAYSDEKIIRHLNRFKSYDFRVFSKHSKTKQREKNVQLEPLHNDLFLESMASSHGIISNAGFGTASEALYLNKSLLVIPMRTQYEQHCNAAVLKSMGVSSVKKLKRKHYPKIENWLESSMPAKVNYPDNASTVVQTIINDMPTFKYKALPETELNFEDATNWFV